MLTSKANMASATTDLLIGKIVTILENEASSISGVRHQIDEIKLELASMKSFLKDAEGKRAQTAREETWVASVRDLTYDVEDTIDEFIYRMYEQQSTNRLARWLCKTIYIPKNLWYRRKIANNLQKLTKKIKDIPDRGQRYGVVSVEGTSSDNIPRWGKNQAESSLYIEEDELVGIEGKKQMLMGLLMNGRENQMVVSVVGMGGSGKTTLVAKTFNEENIKRNFDYCYAWITVSQTYVVEDLFRRLIKEFHQSRKEEVPQHLNSMVYKELLEMLWNYLESKRYLVVLDDVWDIKLWEEIKVALPTRKLGSRIMLTTRNEDIAFYSFGVESHPFKIKLLDNNEAWELFSKKAFSTYDNKRCPPELESLARELVEKCEGLPLAVVALGGLMSSKTPSDWRKVLSSLNWHLENNPLLDRVNSILMLSFYNLPNRLKPCFLYCSLFPEDYHIKRKRLIRLWIAEGFVAPVKGLTLEEVADDYLIELTFRSMLQVVRRNEAGRPKACKMHDLMWELALSTSRKEKFGAVKDGREVVEYIGIRRLSIQSTEGEANSCTGMSELRSFLVFATDMGSLSMSYTLPSGLKLLRVLDLEDVPIDKLPNELVYLFNLRYLNLKGTLIKELPESIGRLHNLQTLNIRDSRIEALPRAIAKLLNLRHLIMYRYTDDAIGFRYQNGTKAPSDITKLKNLQVLSDVESEGKIIKLIGNMTQLTRIGITNVKSRDEMELCDSIQKLKLLHHLLIMASDEEEILQTNALCSPPPHLRLVILNGKLERVPVWFGSLHNLTSMYLHWSRLAEDLLPHIEELPNLGNLSLFNAYVGKDMCFCRGFVKLKRLILVNFPLLNSLTIEKGVMPNLQTLSLKSCMELKAFPQGIEFLANLEELRLGYVPKQLIESIRKGGVHRPKVQHIPVINYVYRTQFGRFYESLS